MRLIKTLNTQSSMRNNTQKIYERLSRGEFLSVDSADASTRHLYEDIEENYEDYADYFKEIGLRLEAGNGYFYFSRIGEGKQAVEQKLDSFSKWLDYLDFLKCYNQSFAAGYQFRKSHLVEQISLDIELKEKAGQSVQKIRRRILSGDRKQADSGDDGHGFCRMHQRAGRDLQGHFRLPLCRGAGQHDSNSQRR